MSCEPVNGKIIKACDEEGSRGGPGVRDTEGRRIDSQ